MIMNPQHFTSMTESGNTVNADQIDAQDQAWTAGKVIRAICGATSGYPHNQMIQHLLGGMSREDLIRLYNDRLSMGVHQLSSTIHAMPR